MSAPVFLSDAAADARPGDVIAVTGDEARHAVTVQRRAPGETVDVVDGAGRRARGVIAETSADQMRVRVESVSSDDDPEVVLVQALAKGGRDEQAVEAAIELGATRIVPWAASRCIVQWRGAKADKARGRWQSLVVAATKQSRRALVATVDPQVSSAELARLVRDAVARGERVLVLHESATAGLATLAWDGSAPTVWLVVGPEGGISDGELAALTDAGAEAVVLGPHVLRASTAGPAALAALAVARGTWPGADGSDDQADGGLR
ncbi:16S rRNA (uracil(1498)-N(3))-methyltransferase [Demequina muriae]|uniref:Ribosomal RNA small subunit methyltransferase E n=1 Tax=Demequina muriae TaxID=3051664 RepID=A0ABT8GJ26_9MICO|nr:16S rRNA (uracil(1498)-N(3))-methyltransferase [Demequina sp. EGI L300058]MDN4481433.1 16S rRNA (uracil(1498)-N(3))-methyltransferase [Demequina sp. EGI L300058]